MVALLRHGLVRYAVYCDILVGKLQNVIPMHLFYESRKCRRDLMSILLMSILLDLKSNITGHPLKRWIISKPVLGVMANMIR